MTTTGKTVEWVRAPRSVAFGVLVLVCGIVAMGGARTFADVPVSGEDKHQLGVVDAAKPGGLLDAMLFYAVGGVAVISSVGICLTKNIVRMAVWLFVALGTVALLYFLLAANFLGAIQLIVYAGGTLVLLIFGVMLTNKSPWVRFDIRANEMVAAGAVCATLLGILCIILAGTTWARPEGVVPGAALVDLGRRLLTTYLVPFEVAGVLLMIVMVGAAHLARQER